MSGWVVQVSLVIAVNQNISSTKFTRMAAETPSKHKFCNCSLGIFADGCKIRQNSTSAIVHLVYSPMAAKSGSSGTLFERSFMQLVMPSKVGASMMIWPPWQASDRACTLSLTLPPYSLRLLISFTCTDRHHNATVVWASWLAQHLVHLTLIQAQSSCMLLILFTCMDRHHTAREV